jgi:hypothetical protein
MLTQNFEQSLHYVIRMPQLIYPKTDYLFCLFRNKWDMRTLQ